MAYKNKEDQAAASHRHYLANIDKMKARARNYSYGHREKARTLINQAKNNPCMDCGVSLIPFAMDFDHVRGEKLFNVGAAANSNLTFATIIKEIAKCDLLCANCHRIRTWDRLFP